MSNSKKSISKINDELINYQNEYYNLQSYFDRKLRYYNVITKIIKKIFDTPISNSTSGKYNLINGKRIRIDVTDFIDRNYYAQKIRKKQATVKEVEAEIEKEVIKMLKDINIEINAISNYTFRITFISCDLNIFYYDGSYTHFPSYVNICV